MYFVTKISAPLLFVVVVGQHKCLLQVTPAPERWTNKNVRQREKKLPGPFDVWRSHTQRRVLRVSITNVHERLLNSTRDTNQR